MINNDFSIYKFIVYARFTCNDQIYYPCLCEQLTKSNLMKDTLLLHNVYALQDTVYNNFRIKNLSVRTENIMYICEGEINFNQDDNTFVVNEDKKDLTEDKLTLINKDEE